MNTGTSAITYAAIMQKSAKEQSIKSNQKTTKVNKNSTVVVDKK